MEARLETRDGAGWRTVSATEETFAYRDYGPVPAGCAGPDLRLAVHNGRLIPSKVTVLVTYYERNTPVTVLQDTWTLERGETRVHEFTIPSSAFSDSSNGGKPIVSVNAQVDDRYLGTCVQEGA